MNLFLPRFAHLADLERRRIPPTPAEALRLHRLERPEPWEAELADEIWRTQPPINWYPDYAAFYAKLADFWGVSLNRIVVGAGIEDLIRNLFILCVAPGDKVAFTWPTCVMFDVYAQAFGAEAVHLVTDPDDPLDIGELIDCIPEGTRLVILPSPGQPVESCYGAEEIVALARHCSRLGAVLAVDEAYYGFGAATVAYLIGAIPNLIVLRTFSKALGGAALRVGFALGLPSVIKPLDAIRQSGEIAGPSLHAASVLMERWESHVEPGIAAVCAGRDWLRRRLAEDGYSGLGKLANHVLVDLCTAERAAIVGQRLWDAGCRVKFGFPAPVDRHLLVTCGSVDLMRQFYAAFNEALAQRAAA